MLRDAEANLQAKNIYLIYILIQYIYVMFVFIEKEKNKM